MSEERKGRKIYPGKELQKLQESERLLSLLEDGILVNAVVIVIAALSYLIDLARFQWLLFLILILGILENIFLLILGLWKGKLLLAVPTGLFAALLIGGFVFLAFL